ncbi:choline/ethanolaminephosphotransferase 1 isoform X6 [Cryptotermes secundus]|uniref:choline/ethanolaminephosphotransferase 1 isoform X6 n=1 Tax=Cryptotermes secundus TaxID=105785 RepID=UPI000CD7C2FB|nr:choline/ethanolaminephosphotransferase 1 isoform X6 [Cryptotermes secundus]
MFYKDKLLSPAQLKRLSDHKYSCSSISLVDPLLQPWWNWLVSKTPLWIAPNLITILGLIVNIITTLILVWYSPDAKAEAPRWACFVCALGLFVYQSLDAIDGKQARRTGTSNPLGELFDHGCDSISTVFVALSACIAVQLGYYPTWMFFQCFCAMTLFYCAHWQTYVSGTLRFGKIDVTEAQISIIVIHLMSAIFGPSVWMMKGTSVLSPVIPFSLVIVPAFIIYRKSVEHVYENHPALYILAFGMAAAKVTNRLVVAHMTKNELEYLDSALIGPAMLFLNQYFNFFLPEYIVLWLCLVWVSLDLLRYSAQVCLEICDHLKIKLFRIPYSKAPPSASTMSFSTPAGEKNASLLLSSVPRMSSREQPMLYASSHQHLPISNDDEENRVPLLDAEHS